MILVTLAVLLLSQQGTAPNARAVITGQVRLASGGPAAAVRIAAIPAPAPNVRVIEGQNYYATQPPAAIALTDAEGRYRLANLAPGRYVILAGLLGAPTFYPGSATFDDAEVVTPAVEKPLVLDFTLRTSPGARVTGRITPPPAAGVREVATLNGVRLGELAETPIAAEGTFDFGRLAPGEYHLGVFPTPPGSSLIAFRTGADDLPPLQITRPPTRVVRGRVVVDRGPLPAALFAFTTARSHVSVTVADDGTFTTRLHAATHAMDVAGMPVGYRIASVRVGGRDAARGVAVSGSDVSDVVIAIAAPAQLPRLAGRIVSAAGAAVAGTRIELTGPIVGRLTATAGADGAFDVPALPSGTYRLAVSGRADMQPMTVVVTSTGSSEVTVRVP